MRIILHSRVDTPYSSTLSVILIYNIIFEIFFYMKGKIQQLFWSISYNQISYRIKITIVKNNDNFGPAFTMFCFFSITLYFEKNKIAKRTYSFTSIIYKKLFVCL